MNTDMPTVKSISSFVEFLLGHLGSFIFLGLDVQQLYGCL